MAWKLTRVPIGAARGIIFMFTESVDVTEKVLSTVFTFPYLFVTLSDTVWTHFSENV